MEDNATKPLTVEDAVRFQSIIAVYRDGPSWKRHLIEMLVRGEEMKRKILGGISVLLVIAVAIALTADLPPTALLFTLIGIAIGLLFALYLFLSK